MRAFRVVTLLLGGVALLVSVAGVVAATYFAPPADLYRIGGIALLGAGESARLSHRGLACADDAANPLVTHCGATVRGRELRVVVEHEPRPRWGFRACTATYDGATTPCRGFNTVIGGPPYAIIDSRALGLTADDLRAVERAWPLENWDEAIWLRLPFVLAALAALGVALLGLNAPASHPVGRAVVAAAGGFTAFFVALPALGLFILSLGYID